MAKKKQKSPIEKLDAWHKTTQGLVVFMLIELAITYGFASWAIDSGQLWQYLLATIFFIGVLQNFVRLIRKLVTS